MIFYILAFITFLILEYKQIFISYFILGISIFVAVHNAINDYLGPITCNDGWHSYSIGLRGACSHHGGVENRGWIGFLSLVTAIMVTITYFQIKNIIIRLKNKETTFIEILSDFKKVFSHIISFCWVFIKLIAEMLLFVLMPLLAVLILPFSFLFEWLRSKFSESNE